MARIRVKNIIDVDDDDDYYEQPCRKGRQQPIQQPTPSFPIIPVPWIIGLVILFPLLSGFFRPMVFSMPSSNPIIVNNSNK